MRTIRWPEGPAVARGGGAAAATPAPVLAGRFAGVRPAAAAATPAAATQNVSARPRLPKRTIAVPLLILGAFALFGFGARMAARDMSTPVGVAAAAVLLPDSETIGKVEAESKDAYGDAFGMVTRRDIGSLCSRLKQLDARSDQGGSVVVSASEIQELRRTADRLQNRFAAQQLREASLRR